MSPALGGRILRLVSLVVPAPRRRVWLREWQAEIAYDLQAKRANPAAHSGGWPAIRLVGAAQHAISLRVMGPGAARSGARASAWAGLPDDVRTTVRGWRHAPVFSVTVVLTLALGVGLFSAVLSFADGYLFRPLPFPGADRTYYVTDPHAPIASALSAADVVALRQSAVAEYGFVEWSASSALSQITIDGQLVDVFPYEVGPRFRDTLAVPLAAGRDFSADDHRQGAPVAAWLSYQFWVGRLSGDQSVVGRTFSAKSFRGPVDVRVVGVLSREVSTFDLNNRPPDLVIAAQGPAVIGPYTLAFPLVMVPEGTSVEQASDRIAAALQAAAPASDGRPRTVRLSSFAAAQVRGGRPTAKLLFTGAVLIFLLAAMNLVHLLLGRAVSRTAEVRTRFALGASRWRVVRALLVESALLGGVGTAAGLLAGRVLSVVIAARVPRVPTGARNLSMVPMIFDMRVVAISAACGVLIALVGGVWPARRAWTDALQPRTNPGAGLPPRLARFILASELTIVTMVAAGVVFTSLGLYEYLHRPLGYEYVDRARITVQLPGKSLAGADAVTALDAVRAASGVRAAGLETVRLSSQPISVSGRAIPTKNVAVLGISAGLFDAWGMKLDRGRWFDAAEFAGSDVVVVDERFARVAWPDADAVGQRLRSGEVSRMVVGVVEPARWRLAVEPSPTVFLPLPASSGDSLIVAWAPDVAIEDLRARITPLVEAAIPGSRVVLTAITFDSLFARDVGEARFQTPVVIAFGVLAGALALVGVFGIVAFLVHQRTREFGVRIALGARGGDITMSVLLDAVRPALVGLTLGTVGAWASASVVESTVFGWHASGVQTMGLVAAGILGVAIVAALVPAARAARVDPAVSLRAD